MKRTWTKHLCAMSALALASCLWATDSEHASDNHRIRKSTVVEGRGPLRNLSAQLSGLQ